MHECQFEGRLCVCARMHAHLQTQGDTIKKKTTHDLSYITNQIITQKRKKKKNTNLTIWVTRPHFLGGGEDNE